MPPHTKRPPRPQASLPADPEAPVPPPHTSLGQLTQEVQELRARVEEAEQTLSAIRYGGVDAFVVSERDGEKVYTLASPERLYRLLVEEMKQGALLVSEEGAILYANRYLQELLGIPLANLVGASIRPLTVPDSLPLFEALLHAGREQGGSQGEVWLQTAQGNSVPAYLRINPASIDGVMGLSIVITDLTEQKRQAEIVSAENLSRSILEQAAEPIVVCDETGLVVRASASARTLCGSNPLLRPFHEAFPLRPAGSGAPLSPTLISPSRLCIEPLHGIEATLQRADGEVMDFLLSTSPLSSAEGRILGGIITLVDVTRLRQAEQALRMSEERLSLALHCAGAGAWEWDITSDRIYWSAEYYSLYGLDTASVQPSCEAWLANVHPDDREQVVREARAALEPEGIQLGSDFRILHPFKGERWLTWRARVFRDAAGKPTRMLGIGIDITERKLAEEERATLLRREQQARREAEAANRDKDEFLSVLSHELRTPLTSMLGWIKLLRSGRLDAANVERGLETIERNTYTQVKLIEDLLDVSRIIAGKLMLDMRPLELYPLIQAAVDTVRPAADAKGVTLTWHCEVPHELVRGDPERLQQVIGNLLSNAVKFTPAGGHVDVLMARAGSQVVLTVADSGIGIDPEFLPFVFDRFRQADSSIVRQYHGLGLGLAIARHLVELHGGSIRAESPGKGLGATFTLELPVPVLAARPPSPSSMITQDDVAVLGGQAQPSLAGIKVLVVEDEVDARELLVTVLHQYGAEVTTAADVQQALALFESARPDLVLSDLGMPGEDGYTLIRKIRDLPPAQGGRIPAIALTAFARTEDRIRALASGYLSHVAKPIEPAELAAAIASIAAAR